jgi:hypothetical protein
VASTNGEKGHLFLGVAVFIIGLLPLLDWFELLGRKSGWNLPPWLAFIFALIFPSMGLFLFFSGLSQSWKSAERKLKWISGFMLAVGMLCFIGGGAIFLTWQTIAPFGESSSYVAIFGIPIPLPEKLQGLIIRFFTGFVALILDVIFIGAIWQGIKLIRQQLRSAK